MTEQHAETLPDPAALQDMFDRYTALRDTIQGLQAEREQLSEQIKAALDAGLSAESELYRATLKRSRRIEYPLDRFREAFGDAAALEAAVIDRKRAEALAKAGDLDLEQLQQLAEVREVVSLVLVARGDD
ncbi:hypothetical protein [Deinococcus sonorensis]|uniref:Uncharacterized protein n=2 Tax=Deinococcus sonorensis TaxID=309891 RepID=A0AAU7UDY6_9DEIO